MEIDEMRLHVCIPPHKKAPNSMATTPDEWHLENFLEVFVDKQRQIRKKYQYDNKLKLFKFIDDY